MDDGRSLDSASERSEEKAVEGYRSPRRFATTGAAGKSARFWTAPVLWRFGRAREMKWTTDEAWIQPQHASGGKAVEDYRSPRRFAITGAAGSSARFWTAPVLWRFGRAREMKWTTDEAWIQPQHAREEKAVVGSRSPRRLATPGAAGKSARFWTAPVL